MKHRLLSLWILPALVLLLALLLVQPASAVGGFWTATGSMATPRFYHTATLLPLAGGKVLVSGGYNYGGTQGSAELYDPATGTWTATGSLITPRSMHTATLLPLAGGKVLVVGGITNVLVANNSTELYDPATGVWTSAAPMSTGRYQHTVTLLPDGRVLVVGGSGGESIGALYSAEVYDPVANTWTPTSPMSAPRYAHSATLLPGGKVLVAGGLGSYLSWASAELYDPAANTWTPTGTMANNCSGHTGILLSNGTVLRVGGCPTAEIYNPATGTWSPTGAPAKAEEAPVLLPNGKVLISGGWNYYPPSVWLNDAEIYDPGAGTWTATGSMEIGREKHVSVLLANGKVLVVGGIDLNTVAASAELYTSTNIPTFKSSGAQDGWVLESSETSNQGGAVNATAATFILGDNANNRQYRSILHFNTSSLPDTAVITRVVLKIRKQSVTGTDPFTTHGKIAVDIRQGPFSQNASLQPTDFQALASKPGAAVIANNPAAGGWYAAALNTAAYPFVNRTGVTQLRLRFQLDDDNDSVADFIRFYSGNAVAANRPVLVVEYDVR